MPRRTAIVACLLWLASGDVPAQAVWGTLEDFETGFHSPWLLYGDPEPLILVGAELLGSNVLVPNGDDRCPSGIGLRDAVAWGDGAGFAVDFATDVLADGRGSGPQQIRFGIFEVVRSSGPCVVESPPEVVAAVVVECALESESVRFEQAGTVVATEPYPASMDRAWHRLVLVQSGGEIVARFDDLELGRFPRAAAASMRVFLDGQHLAIAHVFDDLRYHGPYPVEVRARSFGRLKALYGSALPRARR